MALSHPAVSVRYIRDGAEEFHTPGDGNVQSVIYTLLGREFAKGLLEIKSQDEGVRVTGFATAPAHARGNRSQQHFFVNGRYVRARALQTALEQAYKNVQFTGKFPGCVLYLTLPYGTVDVNVHPTKTEVKFLHDKQVFDAVYYGVLDALEKSSYMPELTLSRGTERVLGEAKSTEKPVGVGSSRPHESQVLPDMPVGARFARPPDVQVSSLSSPQVPFAPSTQVPSILQQAGGMTPPLRVPTSPLAGELRDTPAILYQSSLTLPDTAPTVGRGDLDTPSVSVPGLSPATASVFDSIPVSPPIVQTAPGDADAQSAPLQEIAEPTVRVVGEALGTYILVEQGDDLLFIDKHAAHERILFDQLRARDYTPMAQILLTPITADLGAEMTAILLDHAEQLAVFGFEIEQFGAGTVVLRQVPADIDLDDMESFLADIAAGLRLGKSPNMDALRDEVIHTMACKAAIKAGRQSDLMDLHTLAKRVLSGEAQYCPHGRPVSLRLTRAELDKQVRRS